MPTCFKGNKSIYLWAHSSKDKKGNPSLAEKCNKVHLFTRSPLQSIWWSLHSFISQQTKLRFILMRGWVSWCGRGGRCRRAASLSVTTGDTPIEVMDANNQSMPSSSFCSEEFAQVMCKVSVIQHAGEFVPNACYQILIVYESPLYLLWTIS